LQSRLDAAGGSGIDLVGGSSKEFVAQLNEVCDIWSGLAHFEFELDPQVLRNLVNDDIANGILLDLCRETVSNAIRHGSAKTFHISLSAGELAVQLEIIDDGLFNPGPNPGPPGIGTQMLNACTIDRSQTHNAGSNVLRALLPCLT
jgi:signal transduction histidine kinase